MAADTKILDKMTLVYGQEIVQLKDSDKHGVYLLRQPNPDSNVKFGGQFDKLTIIDTILGTKVETLYSEFTENGDWLRLLNKPPHGGETYVYDTKNHTMLWDNLWDKFRGMKVSKEYKRIYIGDSEGKEDDYEYAKHVTMTTDTEIITKNAMSDPIEFYDQYVAFNEEYDGDTIVFNTESHCKVNIPANSELPKIERLRNKKGILVLLERFPESSIAYINTECTVASNTVKIPLMKLRDTKRTQISNAHELITIGLGEDRHAFLIDTEKCIILKLLPAAAKQFISVLRKGREAKFKFNTSIDIEVYSNNLLEIKIAEGYTGNINDISTSNITMLVDSK